MGGGRFGFASYSAISLFPYSNRVECNNLLEFFFSFFKSLIVDALGVHWRDLYLAAWRHRWWWSDARLKEAFWRDSCLAFLKFTVYLLILECGIFICYPEGETLEILRAEMEDKENIPTHCMRGSLQLGWRAVTNRGEGGH